jgi:hypothetical protein
LVSTKQLQIPDNVALLGLLQTSSTKTLKKDGIPPGCAWYCMREKVFKSDTPCLRVSVSQKGYELEAD